MSVWEVSAVAILDSSVNCACVWSTKKLTMPVYCVAANCNNSQTTPGITMHELLRNRPAVRWKWIKFIQFKQAVFLAAPHHAHLCSEHFIVRFRKPHGIPHGVCFEADTMSQYSFKILPDRFRLIQLLAILQRLPRGDVVGIWSRDLGIMATLSVQQKMPFFSVQ